MIWSSSSARNVHSLRATERTETSQLGGLRQRCPAAGKEQLQNAGEGGRGGRAGHIQVQALLEQVGMRVGISLCGPFHPPRCGQEAATSIARAIAALRPSRSYHSSNQPPLSSDKCHHRPKLLAFPSRVSWYDCLQRYAYEGR